MRIHARYDELCAVLLLLLCGYALFSIRIAVVIDIPVGSKFNYMSSSVIIQQFGSLLNPILTTNIIGQRDNNDITEKEQNPGGRRALIISAAPRSKKHIVSLWSSLECFTGDADHVVISAPTWSQPIIEQILAEASTKIPRFASDQVSLEGMVSVNDRYDVGLWCDALTQIGIGSSGNVDKNTVSTSSFDAIGLLNDSVFALREFTGIFSELKDRNVSMTSLNYSLIHPKGIGPEYYWLESVWRGFDQEGIRTFVDHSCRDPDDPLFCSGRLWGRKGCIVENFERAMSRQFPREKTSGIFKSDVPKEMLTWKDSFPSWVRHPPYWEQLVREEAFPVSKLNWKGMIDSIDDVRLKTCTQHLDRSWLDGFDFSIVKASVI